MDNSLGGRDFHHPFQPYDIQKEFMTAVYNCLEEGKVGIFESPTGTGKSLSLICGSLTWLRDHQRRTFEEGFTVEPDDSNEPSWILEHAQKQQKLEALHRKHELHKRIAKIKAQEQKIKKHCENNEGQHKRRKLGRADTISQEIEAQFVLDDYESDEETRKDTKANALDGSGLSADTVTLMQTLGYSGEPTRDEHEDSSGNTKIFFCSRTHSQLTQFSGELRRVSMPPSIISSNDESEEILAEDVKHLTLGSRKNLCINSKVRSLGSGTAINERCLELQQDPRTGGRCSYMPTKENDALIHDFRDHALAKIRDIEDLELLGQKLGICPYYASRSATKDCEILTLPYPLLLQKTSREALGLSLRNHVVIIDEAHNLMDTIAGIYSVTVTLDQVQEARNQLTRYLQRFRNKLKGKNRAYVAQTVRVLNSIVDYLQTVNDKPGTSEGLVDMVSILSGRGVDQINIFKLIAYLQDSRLARKVDRYTAYTDQGTTTQVFNDDIKISSQNPKLCLRENVPVLMHVQTFMLSLINPSAEGRFFYAKEDGLGVTLRYMLLDSTFHFKDIVEDARAVILAGGTMSPMSDYEQHLLSYLDNSAISKLSCGHVIPPTNLLAVPIVQTPTGHEFNFTFENRNKETTIVELGLALIRFACDVPDGMVIFFPSYSYLDVCITVWKRQSSSASSTPSGSLGSIWDTFTAIKPVFLEQRRQLSVPSEYSLGKSAAVPSILTEYAAAISNGNGRGAMLFAVIGGTLSEGINFSDALGRCVVVVGLPFSNPHSAEWKAKMQYIASRATRSGGDGKAAAREYYENACMRAVNQCIGRAIRHKGDYSAILMLDKRYGSDRIQSKLPNWIQKSLLGSLGANDVGARLKSFFMGKTL